MILKWTVVKEIHQPNHLILDFYCRQLAFTIPLNNRLSISDGFLHYFQAASITPAVRRVVLFFTPMSKYYYDLNICRYNEDSFVN